MLGLLWLLLVSGCGAGGQASFFAPATTGTSPEPRAEPPPPSRFERPPRPAPADPGADALLRSIRESLEPAADRSSSELRIGMEGVRNQSHASAAEFVGLRLRLAELLTRSGLGAAGERPIRFVAAGDDAVDFELTGTVYMAETDGDDQWELYLALRPAGRSWAIWEAQGPVRMPRRPRPGEPQIILR
ncbi:MAG: hypothetical protein ACYTEI_00895 [Planctomycetota bacterium]